MILVPILFLVGGYLAIYVVGRPVIQFVTSTVNVMLLNEAPTFDDENNQAFKPVDDAGLKELDSSQIKYPVGGTKYGRVIIKDLKINEPLYFGDSQVILRQGAGQFMGSVFPGELGTTLIGGHNTQSFGKLLSIKTGTHVLVQTTYGNYTYEVTSAKVEYKKAPNVQKVLDQRSKRILMLYTCYPIGDYRFGVTNDRMFVQCQLISGPIINEKA